MFKVVFKKKASKELFKLPLTILKKISIQIDSLQFNPKPEGVKKLKASEENLWRLRVGDYRIIYLIENDIKNKENWTQKRCLQEKVMIITVMIQSSPFYLR